MTIGAQVAQVNFNLSATPSTSDAQAILNGVCTTIQAGAGQVVDQTGLSCNNVVARMLQTTNTTTNTTIPGVPYYIWLIQICLPTAMQISSTKLHS